MELTLYNFILFVWFALMGLSNGADVELLDREFLGADRWMRRNTRPQLDEMGDNSCSRVRPELRDIVKRIYAILPFFDREHANTDFLRKFRATIHNMADQDELLNREAAYYASVLTPLIFMQHYRDTWCLLERFHRAIRLYKISHPTEKRSALKLLQNFRAVSNKVQLFVRDLPGPTSRSRTTTAWPYDAEDEELHDKKDIKYLKELIKNLG